MGVDDRRRPLRCLEWSYSLVEEEDELALDVRALKSCPLLDNSGQNRILARDGLSANDPKRPFVPYQYAGLSRYDG
jgi:hypothetical protein